MRPRLDVLISPGFVIGLAILLLNDFVLKDAWPSVATGKLSDFAGLWAFAMCGAAVVPSRRRSIYAATALFFIWWKSPWSLPAVDGWNAVPLFDVTRVVDYTDLIALAALPASLAYFSYIAAKAPSPAPSIARRSSMAVAMLVSLFAFGATSYDNYGIGYYPPYRDGVYVFSETPALMIQRLNESSIDATGRKFDAAEVRDNRYTFWIAIPTDLCGETFDAQVDLRRNARSSGGGSWVELRRINLQPGCPRDADDRGRLYADFERRFVRPLGGQMILQAYPPIDGRARTPIAEFEQPPRPDAGLTPVATYDPRYRMTYDEFGDAVSYEFDLPRYELITKLNRLRLDARGRQFDPLLPGGSRTVYELEMRSAVCVSSVGASVLFRELPRERTQLVLQEIRHTCNPSGLRLPFKEEFEREIVAPLQAP